MAWSPGQEPQSGRPLHCPLLPFPSAPAAEGWVRHAARPPAQKSSGAHASARSRTSCWPACPAVASSPGEELRECCVRASLFLFFFFLSFFNCIFLLPCSPFLFYGSVTTKAGRTKQVTFPGIAAAAAVFSAKISKRVKKKKKKLYILL